MAVANGGKNMKLYLVKRETRNCSSGEWYSAVVAAKSKKEAQALLNLASSITVTVSYIGTAAKTVDKGVVWEGYFPTLCEKPEEPLCADVQTTTRPRYGINAIVS